MEKSPIKPFVGLAPSTPVLDKAVQDFQHMYTSEYYYKEDPEMEYNVPLEVGFSRLYNTHMCDLHYRNLQLLLLNCVLTLEPFCAAGICWSEDVTTRS